MRESKKQSSLIQRLSILVPVMLIVLFVYMNVREPGHSHDSKVQQLQMITAVASLPWKDTDQDIVNNVYYGLPSDLNRPIVMTESGQDHTSIVVEDNQEELIDLVKINNPRIRPISEIDPSQKTKSSQVRKSVYDALIKMLDNLPDKIGIAYYCGFVPLAEQHAAFDRAFKATQDVSPDAYDATWVHVEPVIENPTPSYSTGGVIDMTLFSKGDEVHLLDLGLYGSRKSETFASDVSNAAQQNRLMLLRAATTAGFVNYGMQWWRFSIGDKMWAYVKQKRSTMYDVVEQRYTPPFKSRQEYLHAQEANTSDDVSDDLDDGADAEEPSAKPELQESVTTALPTIAAVADWDAFLDKNKEQLVVARFFNPACKKCAATAEPFAELANPSAVYVNVDVTAAKELQERYDFKGKPHYLMFYRGQNVLKVPDISEVPAAVAQLQDSLDQDDE